jgi:hypothetical protein
MNQELAPSRTVWVSPWLSEGGVRLAVLARSFTSAKSVCGWTYVARPLPFAIHNRTGGADMPNQKPSPETWGNIINVDAQVRAPRGATKNFEEGLLLLLAAMVLGEDACVIMHPDYLVARSAFPATVAGETACSNMRQTLGGRLRSHFDELVRRGDLPSNTRLSINWAPDDAGEVANRPQCSLKARA